MARILSDAEELGTKGGAGREREWSPRGKAMEVDWHKAAGEAENGLREMWAEKRASGAIDRETHEGLRLQVWIVRRLRKAR